MDQRPHWAHRASASQQILSGAPGIEPGVSTLAAGPLNIVICGVKIPPCAHLARQHEARSRILKHDRSVAVDTAKKRDKSRTTRRLPGTWHTA